MDLGGFSQATLEHPPCGIDLDDSGELFMLEQTACWDKAEVEVDWTEVRDAASSALARSRDLRVCPYLAGALLHTDGVVAFCDALVLLRSLLETFWDDIYPKLDDGDATERSNAVFNFTNYHRIIRPLRTLPLVEDRAAGRFSLQDYNIALGKVDLPEDYEGDAPQLALIEAAFRAVPIEHLHTLNTALGRAVENVKDAEALFSEHVGSEAAPDLLRLRDTLQAMNNMTETAFAGREDGNADTDAGDDGRGDFVPDGPEFASVATPGVAIRSREDVGQHIDEILHYFRVHEPSSPVPLLLRRAKRLLHMDFMAIVEDVAPDAVQNVVALGGKESDSNTQEGTEGQADNE